MNPEDQKNAERQARQLAEADQTLEMAFSSDDMTDIYDFDSSSTDDSAQEASASELMALVNYASPTIDVASFRPPVEDYVSPASSPQRSPVEDRKLQVYSKSVNRAASRNQKSAGTSNTAARGLDQTSPEVARPNLSGGYKDLLGAEAGISGDDSDDSEVVRYPESPQPPSETMEGISDKLFGRSSTPLADQVVEPAPSLLGLSSQGSPKTRKPGEDPPEKEWQPEDWRRDTPEKSSSTSAIRSNDQEQSATLETNAQNSESFIDAIATVMNRLAAAVINAHQRLDEIERTLDGYDIDDFSGAE